MMTLIFKIIAFIILLFIISIKLMADELIVPVINFYDADTAEIRLSLPEPLNKTFVRIRGIDAPEIPAKSYEKTGKLGRAKCNKEAELAIRARNYVRVLVSIHGNSLILKNYEWDKYGGRVLADAFIRQKQTGELINIGTEIIKRKFAIRYNGGKREFDWCK